MFAKIGRYLDQAVRYFRSSSNNCESIRHKRSNSKVNHQSIRLTNLQISESTDLFESNQLATIESFGNKMKRKSSNFDQLCQEFEIRIENSVQMIENKVEVKCHSMNDTIIIDDDVEEEISNLINKRQKTGPKKDVRMFNDITSKLQNVQTNQQHSNRSNSILKSITSNENLISSTEKATKDDLKAKFKNLKPENYRIQQVIKQEDLVFFDLETGGMGSKQDILQIGAINHQGIKFNYYATPTQHIPGMSSRIHHITFKDNQLYYRKNPVKHQSIIEVLLKFCDYLNDTKSNNIVLVAHNANFDRRFLIEKMFDYNLQSRLNVKILGFLDTLPLFRQLIPGKESYKQDRLILSHFPHTKTDFHNALTDVIYLKKLFDKVALVRMKNEYKFINSFTQSLEYGFLKKEQQLFEEMSSKKPAKKSSPSKPKKVRKKTSSIFIEGVPVPRETRSKRKKPDSKTTNENRRKSLRLKK